jgi:hypothetical protein
VDKLCELCWSTYRRFSLAASERKAAFTPWLNQIELWFARIERDMIARGIFSSVKDLALKLIRYIHAYWARNRFPGSTAMFHYRKCSITEKVIQRIRERSRSSRALENSAGAAVVDLFSS